MEGSVAHTYLSDILHAVSQALLAPDIILLLAFIGYALFCIGGVVVEYFTERKHFKITMPKFLSALMSATEDGIPDVIEQSGLLRRQKVALLTVYDYRTLPGDALVALIRRLVNEEESRYGRITARNNMAARISPMLGLMGTLIPLGPGIQALGNADTAALSSSLLIAFDTTVAGLVVAAVCLVVGKIRSVWYDNYMSALDSAMATMLQKIEDMRAKGKITVQEPSNYAFLFEQTAAKSAFGTTSREEEIGGGFGRIDDAEAGSVPEPQKYERREPASNPEPAAQVPAASAAAGVPVSSFAGEGSVRQQGADFPRSDFGISGAPTYQAYESREMPQVAQASALDSVSGSVSNPASNPVTNPVPDNPFGLDPIPELTFENPFAVAEASAMQNSETSSAATVASAAAPASTTASSPAVQQSAAPKSRVDSGWYQPRLHKTSEPTEPYVPGKGMTWGARRTSGASDDSSEA